MSEHRAQRRGGVAAGGDSPGSTFADGEVRVGLTDLILGNGPEAPQYSRVFSQAASLQCFSQYAVYERSMEFSNNAHSIPRPIGFSTVAEVYPYMPVANLFRWNGTEGRRSSRGSR